VSSYIKQHKKPKNKATARILTGRWMAKLVARLLATAVLRVRIQTSLKKHKMGDIKQRSGQHTLESQKRCQKEENFNKQNQK
jgi:hypothetical protein